MGNKQQPIRTVGIDLHPDSFAAVALGGGNARKAQTVYCHKHVAWADAAAFLERNTLPTDTLVLEASSMSFAFVDLARSMDRNAIVLESVQAGQFGKAYCKHDALDAEKLARAYL